MAFFRILIFCTLMNISMVKAIPPIDLDPWEEVDRSKILFSSGSKCNEDINCSDAEKCINSTCRHVCISECLGLHEGCSGSNHTGICVCRPGYLHNFEGICEISCSASSDCGRFEECITGENGTNMCQCENTYIRDPYKPNQCELSRVCHNDNACQDFEKCVDNECIDVCSMYNCTKTNQGCIAAKHTAKCVCQAGYRLKTRLVHTDEECEKVQCVVDDDCGSYSLCIEYPTWPRCVCIINYQRDYTNHGRCAQLCAYRSDCTEKGYWCNGRLCIPCDGTMCDK